MEPSARQQRHSHQPPAKTEVVTDSNLAAFLRRLFPAENVELTFQPSLPLEALHVKCADVRPIAIRLPGSTSSIQVGAHLCEFEYSYRDKHVGVRHQPMEQMVAVSVGDMLRYVYQTHKVLEVPNNKELGDKLTDLLVQVQKLDIGHIDPTNWLGEMSQAPGAVLLWDSRVDLLAKRTAPQHRASLTAFCHALVFHRRHRLAFRTKGQVQVDRKGVTGLFTNLATPIHAIRLLRYFLEGEDPSRDPSYTTTYTFNPPLSMPDIALRLLQETGDQSYHLAYKRLTTRINRRLQLMLETKYRPATFNCPSQVPDEYPEYALRNVHLRKCTGDEASWFGINQRPFTGLNRWSKSKHKVLQEGVRDDVLRQLQFRDWSRGSRIYKHTGHHKADKLHLSNLLDDALDALIVPSLQPRQVQAPREHLHSVEAESVCDDAEEESVYDDESHCEDYHRYYEDEEFKCDELAHEENPSQESNKALEVEPEIAAPTEACHDPNGFRLLDDTGMIANVDDVVSAVDEEDNCGFELI